jgi:peptidyl-prolyl cis-trans isomerase D
MALDFMRRHRQRLKVLLWVVILGLTVSFVLYFIPMGGPGELAGETLATVGGRTISAGEFQRELNDRRQMFARQLELSGQRRFNREQIQQMVPAEAVLQQLADEHAMLMEIDRLGLYVDDQTLERRIRQNPRFHRAGQFDGAELQRFAQEQGWTLAELNEKYRVSLMQGALQSLITSGVDVSDAELEQEFRRRNEKVRIEYVLVDAAGFHSGVTVTDDQVKARFDSNREAYRVPERRVVSYLLVEREAMRARSVVTDAEISEYYGDHEDEFYPEAQACAHHILVKVKSGPQAEGHEEEAARKIAESLLDKIKGGASFEEVAKKESEDRASAVRGGDLGCFPPGQMLPDFDAEAFTRKVGELSEPFRTTHGYHIIRVDSRQGDEPQPLDQVKDRIRAIVLDRKIREALDASASRVAADLERGRTLEDAAKEQGLAVKKTAPFARDQVVDPLSAAAVARAFEMKPSEVDGTGYGVPRGRLYFSLADVQPSRVPELKEVQDRAKADLVQEKALEMAREKAGRLKAQAETAGLAKAATALGLARKETPALVDRGRPLGELGSGAAVDEAAFGLAEKALSDPVRVANGYAVLRVLEKKAFDPAAFEKEKASLRASLREGKRQRLFQAYRTELRRRFPVQVRTEVFRRFTG